MTARFATAAALLGALLATSAAAQVATRTLTSPQPRATGLFGFASAGVPDVDGDGRGDVLVGAYPEDGGAAGAGQIHLYSGSTGALLRTLASPNPKSGGNFGVSVSGVADANGDGRGDLLVGAYAEDMRGFPGVGRAYLFSGSTGALLFALVTPNPTASGYFGRSVSGVPDADGDGRGDLLVGAPREDGGSGRAYLYSGSTGTLLRTLTNPNPTAGRGFGISVSGVPDATGDGRSDLLIGTTDEGGATDPGRAYLFSGASGALLRTLVSPSPEPDGDFGYSVSGVPDVNGDGLGDLLIGATDEDAGASDSGRAYLYSGSTGTLLQTIVSPNPAASGRFGVSVFGMPDANGDGRGDVLVGAPDERVGTSDSGRAYLFSGSTGALLRPITSPNSEAAGNFGRSVSGVPDTNEDGRSDLLVGADFEDGGATNAGRAYLFASLTRDVTLGGPEGWRLLTVPVASTMADLLAEAWTQGALGADVSDGDPTVFAYAEPVAGPRGLGFAGLTDLRTGAPAGTGRAVYLFADDDLLTPGIQGGFPKTLTAVGHTRSGHPAAFPVTFTPTGSVQEDGWNLLGTPWTLNLDWDAAGWTKTNVDNTIYVYDPAAGVYRTWNGTAGSLGDGVVAEFQGFWVKAYAVSPVLVAPTAARVGTAPPQTPLGPALGLRLAGTIGGTAVADDAFVAFVSGATDALDRFDAYELAPFTSTFAALYTEADALLDIEARAPLDGQAVFTIGAAAVLDGQAAGGAFTLSWPDLSAVPDAWRLTLTDLASNVSIDLRTQPSYPFTLAAGLAPERVLSGSLMTPPVPTPLAFTGVPDGFAPPARFLLHIEAGTVGTEDQTPAAFSLTAAPNPTSATSRLAYALPAAADVRLTVVDVLGREVAVLAEGAQAAGMHDALFDAARLAPGAYVVRLQAGASVLVRRVTVVRAGR